MNRLYIKKKSTSCSSCTRPYTFAVQTPSNDKRPTLPSTCIRRQKHPQIRCIDNSHTHTLYYIQIYIKHHNLSSLTFTESGTSARACSPRLQISLPRSVQFTFAKRTYGEKSELNRNCEYCIKVKNECVCTFVKGCRPVFGGRDLFGDLVLDVPVVGETAYLSR